MSTLDEQTVVRSPWPDPEIPGSDLTTFVLRRDVFVPGVAVSGTVHWTYTTGRVRAVLVVHAGGTVERLRMRWSQQVRAAMADIDGHADGRPLHAHMLAP